nr:cupin domain-containing protein [Alsobacter ponti]
MGELEDKNLHVLDVTVPPGSGTPLHRHASPEVFRVSEGEITFGFHDKGRASTVVAGPGSIVTLPGRVEHSYSNQGSAPAVMTVIVEAQMVAFFRDIGSPQRLEGRPSPDTLSRVAAACARHGIEILASATD